MVQRGFVVSDLHLFSRRSQGEKILQQIRSQLPSIDLFVFNGDTFDLAWSDRPNLAQVTTEALRLLEELVITFPNCKFHFLFGNHDCAPSLVDGIRALEARYANLTSYEQYLCLGNNLFLHGDVCNYKMNASGLRHLRSQYAVVIPRSKFARAIYELIIYTRLNRVAYVTHPRAEMIARIYHYLESVPPGVTKGIKRIFFGHTHAPFNHRDVHGVEFVNTGSAIRGLRSNFCEFQVEGN